MTNEELVLLIQQGDDGLLPQLWEQLRRFIAMMARRHYKKLDNKYGCELEDLIQAGYLGLVAAIKYYKPEKDLKFISYLEFPLKKAFNEALGIRSSKRDWLDYSTSLDVPVGEDKTHTLLDMLGDMTPGTADVEEKIIEDVFNQELRNALDDAMEVLSKRQKDIIVLLYYFNLNMSQIAGMKNTSKQYIGYLHEEALDKIYNSKHRRILQEFMPHYGHIQDPFSKTGYTFWKETGCSSVEAFLINKNK